MNTQELLQPFCAVDDNREYLHYIFKKGDLLCASNGHIIVRVPDDKTVEIDPRSTNTLDIDRLLNLDTWPADGFIQLEFTGPDVIHKCSTCEGTGKTFEKEECDECDGEGEFEYGEHTYECKECDGEGKLRAYSGEKCDCEDCQGTGIKYKYLTIPDGRQFNYQYILKLMALPGISYLPDYSDDEHGLAPMRFKFDNGLGLLMPVRK